MPEVACKVFSQRRRSSSANSSAVVGSYSGCFRSTPRTQWPRACKYLTRWWPMKPPAPVTSTREVGRCCPLVVCMYVPFSLQWSGSVPSQALRQVLADHQDDENRNVFRVAAPQAPRLHQQPEEPLQAARLHPARRLPQRARVEIESRSDTHQWTTEVQSVCVRP